MTEPTRHPWQPSYHVDDLVTLHLGDNLAMLRAGATLGYDFDLGYEPTRLVPDCSVDAVVTDPPYGIGFMGHEWDQPGEYSALKANGRPSVHRRRPDGDPELISQGAMEAGRYDLSRSANALFGAWCEAWARECLRVLKPGGHILAFGGARTWHRLQTAIEDAGFEIRDSIAWLYGSGFPKSLDVARAIDKSTGVEGEWRREDHPGRSGSRTNTGEIIGQTGHTGPDNPEGLRHVYEPAEAGRPWQGWGTALKPAFEPIVVGRKPLAGTVAANVLAHGVGALHVDACRVGTDGGRRRNGEIPGPSSVYDGPTAYAASADLVPGLGRWPTNVALDDVVAAQLDAETGVLTSGTMRAGTERQARAGGTIYGADARNFVPSDTYGDSGGASRFFPTFRYEAKAPTSERPRLDDGTAHPTVKPLDLMRWCVRLVTRPGGVVLDLFNGSGTTAEACVIEGMRYIGIERHKPYMRLTVEQRLAKPIQADIFGAAL